MIVPYRTVLNEIFRLQLFQPPRLYFSNKSLSSSVDQHYHLHLVQWINTITYNNGIKNNYI